METTQGTGTILGIMLNISKIEDALVVEESVFDGITNLQFLIFHHCLRDKLNFPLGLNCLPRKLRLLHWDYCPLRVWPSTFSTKFLVELIMRGSKFEKLWEGIQVKYFCIEKKKHLDSKHMKCVCALCLCSHLRISSGLI